MEMVYKFDQAIDKLLGLDKEDSPINLEKLESNDYEMVLSKKQAKLVNQILKNGGSVNMNVPDITEIDFEEVNDES